MFIKSFDNTKIYYSKFVVKKPKATILFVHGGFHGNHTTLKPLLKQFKKEYNIIAPDLRGRGDSDFPNSKENKLEDYAKDIKAIINKEKPRKLYVVGVSFGGLVALKLAQMYNGSLNINKMVLISSTHRLDKLKKRLRITGVFYRFFINLLSVIVHPFPANKKNHIDYSINNTKFYNIKYLSKILKNNSLKTIMIRYRLAKKSTKYKIDNGDLKKIDPELLMIYGRRDFFFPLSAQKELFENTNAEIEIFPKAGHELYLKYPYQVSQMIKNFFLRATS